MDNNSSFKRVLSLRDLILFGLSFMAPATVFATYGIAAITSGGMVAAGYVITSILVFFSAYSYARMAKQFPSSGSAFIYVKEVLGSKAGFIVGWSILLDYLLSPMISSLIFGLFMNAYFPEVSNTVFIIGFLLVVATINILGVKMAANYGTVIVALQIAFIITFVAFATDTISAEQGTQALFSALPFYDESVSIPNLVLGAVPILFFSFLGFDAITTLAEETRSPEQAIPKAIYSIVSFGTMVFAVCAYFMQLLIPDSTVFQNPDTASMEVMARAGSSFLVSAFMILTVLGTTASATASCSSAARILYSMGKDGVLPQKGFGYLSKRFRTPVFNIVLICLLGLSSIFMTLTFATHLISFGVVFSFLFVNFSVFVFFFIQKKQGGWFKNVVLPIAGCLINAFLLFALGMDATLLGIAWLTIGGTYLLVSPKNKSFDMVDNI
ncbi:amino acid permease [Vibrio sp. Y2-5]|uniref:APC family permease n=1 Tax=Vibrio sp. Y2-5 TaxID=2743977 RepID=UPI001660159C|nr:APC family permease [Vibrio sp. Y2-5]MBD0788347.1 amino acid permease [Vibrio sp. Y2-5]